MNHVLLSALGAALSLAVATPAQTASTPSLSLEYRPILAPETGKFIHLEVTLRFRGESDGETWVRLPSAWGGETELYRHLSAITAKGASIARNEPAILLLKHRPGAHIVLRYRVSGTDRPDSLAAGEQANEYRPIISPEYFHLLGETVIARPEHIADDSPARFAIRGMPTGAAFASDLEHVVPGQRLRVADLIESVAVGGDFRIIQAGANARLAIRGRFAERDDDGWRAVFAATTKAVTGYWESDTGPYLVTILPFAPSAPGSISVGGTGRSDAFAFFATTNAAPDTIDTVMAHEMTHSWVPRRIGGLPQTGEETESYWLSEGFTDFATYRALVRSGAWSIERFAEQMNIALAEYDALGIRAMPNVDSAKSFWSSREGQRLPYLRGMLFASWIDDQLARRPDGAGLRSVLLAMQAAANPSATRAPSTISNQHAEALLRAAMARAGLPIDDAIDRFIVRGEPIAFDPEFLSVCGSLVTIERAVFHRGFDVEATQKNGGVISGVVANGPAWRAGLRDGMRLVRRSGGEIGNSAVQIAYEIEDSGTKKELRWLPEGSAMEKVRRFRLAAMNDAARREACRTRLSN